MKNKISNPLDITIRKYYNNSKSKLKEVKNDR